MDPEQSAGRYIYISTLICIVLKADDSQSKFKGQILAPGLLRNPTAEGEKLLHSLVVRVATIWSARWQRDKELVGGVAHNAGCLAETVCVCVCVCVCVL